MKAMGASRGLHWCVGNCVRKIREGYVTGIKWSAVGMRAVGRRWGQPDKRIGDDSEYGETTVEGLRLSGEGRALTPVPGRKVVYAHGWRGIPIWGSRSRGLFPWSAFGATRWALARRGCPGPSSLQR